MKPSIPKGTRDLSPEVVCRRNLIFNTIREVFDIYGYMPIETPAMENIETLLGKYGDDGDKLVFKVLNSGDFLSPVQKKLHPDTNSQRIATSIAGKGLRYDLTVPFARYVVMNQHELTFPFKRYQIQPVWRADRPQRGRYREFYQCDADVIGSKSLLNEVELLEMIDEVFQRLKLGVTIRLNNRKILSGIAEYIGAFHKLTDITMAIDKIDKIGFEKVNEELLSRGLSIEAVNRLTPILHFKGDTKKTLKFLKDTLPDSPDARMGIFELERIMEYVDAGEIGSEVVLDLTLARGLDYYTGAIIEVTANEISIGSVCGGGRYDDLTGVFGLKNMSGVGISFGADRIYDAMMELDLFPSCDLWGPKLLFVNFGPEEELHCLPYLSRLRRLSIRSEIYPEHDKMKKQMNYADKRHIPFVAIVGSNEMDSNTFTLKDMSTGEQEAVDFDTMVQRITA